MSGSPKFVSPSLTAAIRATIESARRAEAVHEAGQRRTTADAWLQQQSMARRNAIIDQATALEHELASVRLRMSPGDEIAISDEINRVRATINAAAQPDLSNVEAMLILTRRRLNEALGRARVEDTQERQTQQDIFQTRLAGMQARLESLTAAVDTTVEEEALQEARENIAQAQRSSTGSDPTLADYHARLANKAIDRLEHHVEQDARRQLARRQTAEMQLLQFESVLAGLQADPTVMRWLAASVAEMQLRAEALRQRLADNDYTEFEVLGVEAGRLEREIVDRANEAQIKADQRDYIARGIRDSLAEMGFVVSEITREVPSHPASAVAFSAVNEVGRGISVSVPVDGEVFYDVDGYHKSTVSKVGGGTAAVCDSAQQVLEEMHDMLEDSFHVKMGELMWEGKDPDRILRQADELPHSGIESDREDSR